MSYFWCGGKGGMYIEQTYLGCKMCNSSAYINCYACIRELAGSGCLACRDNPSGIKCRECGVLDTSLQKEYRKHVGNVVKIICVA